MKLATKLLSLLGALAGVCYLGQKAIGRAYAKTLHRYVVMDGKGEPVLPQQPPSSH